MVGFTDLSLLFDNKRADPLLFFRWVVTGEVPFSQQFGIDHTWIESVELPFPNIQADGVFGGSTYSYFPQFHNVAAVTVNIYGDGEGKFLKWLMYWKSQVKNLSTGLYKLPYQYKRDLQVSLLNSKGSEIVKAKLLGIWPADTGNLSLDYNGSERVIVSQNFSVDDVVFEVK